MVKFYSGGEIPPSNQALCRSFALAAVFPGRRRKIITLEVTHMGGNKDGQKKKSKADREAKTGTAMKRNP